MKRYIRQISIGLALMVLLVGVLMGCAAEKSPTVEDVLQGNGYLVTSRGQGWVDFSISKDALPDSIYDPEGCTFGEGEIAAGESYNTTLWIKSVRPSEDGEDKLRFTFGFTHGTLPQRGEVCVPYWPAEGGGLEYFSEDEPMDLVVGDQTFPGAVMLCSAGPGDLLEYTISREAFDGAEGTLKFRSRCYFLGYAEMLDYDMEDGRDLYRWLSSARKGDIEQVTFSRYVASNGCCQEIGALDEDRTADLVDVLRGISREEIVEDAVIAPAVEGGDEMIVTRDGWYWLFELRENGTVILFPTATSSGAVYADVDDLHFVIDSPELFEFIDGVLDGHYGNQEDRVPEDLRAETEGFLDQKEAEAAENGIECVETEVLRLSAMEAGTERLTYPVEVWECVYGLTGTRAGAAVEEYPTCYLLFLRENGACRLEASYGKEEFFARYGTDELRDRFGTAYAAAAVELYLTLRGTVGEDIPAVLRERLEGVNGLYGDYYRDRYEGEPHVNELIVGGAACIGSYQTAGGPQMEVWQLDYLLLNYGWASSIVVSIEPKTLYALVMAEEGGEPELLDILDDDDRKGADERYRERLLDRCRQGSDPGELLTDGAVCMGAYRVEDGPRLEVWQLEHRLEGSGIRNFIKSESSYAVVLCEDGDEPELLDFIGGNELNETYGSGIMEYSYPGDEYAAFACESYFDHIGKASPTNTAFDAGTGMTILLRITEECIAEKVADFEQKWMASGWNYHVSKTDFELNAYGVKDDGTHEDWLREDMEIIKLKYWVQYENNRNESLNVVHYAGWIFIKLEKNEELSSRGDHMVKTYFGYVTEDEIRALMASKGLTEEEAVLAAYDRMWSEYRPNTWWSTVS